MKKFQIGDISAAELLSLIAIVLKCHYVTSLLQWLPLTTSNLVSCQWKAYSCGGKCKTCVSQEKRTVTWRKNEQVESESRDRGERFAVKLLIFGNWNYSTHGLGWWFGILGVPPSSNPFHKGIPGIQPPVDYLLNYVQVTLTLGILYFSCDIGTKTADGKMGL